MRVVNVEDFGGKYAFLNPTPDERVSEKRIYIGRPGPFGNPFRVGVRGRKDAIEQYRRWLWRRLNEDQRFADEVRAIPEDAMLGCHCSPQACHGHVLARAWRWLHGLTP